MRKLAREAVIFMLAGIVLSAIGASLFSQERDLILLIMSWGFLAGGCRVALLSFGPICHDGVEGNA